MGPTNIALVKLFTADQQLRQAQERYDQAARSVRLQERKVNELAARLQATQQTLRENQSSAAQLDLDIKTRDAKIEKFRTQQQQAKNAKEYQAFLVEINTEKADRNKVEDETLKVLEQVERLQGEAKAIGTQLEEERKRLNELQAQIGGRLAELQADIDRLRPAREQAYSALPPKARQGFERLSEHHEGEAMAPLVKPDKRREEYVCGSCNMSLVVDVYNRLHSRDELVTCASCGRLLYIPDDLPPDQAINKAKEKKEPRKKIPGAAANRQELAESVVGSVDADDEGADEGGDESGGEGAGGE
jgi:predicted  nucleic acid-binding Zn-ribbon protein